MNKFYLLLVTVLSFGALSAQTISNYTYSTGTNGSLSIDRNGNAVDMSTGTTTLIGPSLNTTGSTSANIGFDFIFMGTVNSTFNVSSHGLLGLTTTINTGNNIAGGAGPRIGALVGGTSGTSMGTHSTGKVHYKVVGTAPNRTLVVEWLNMSLTSASTSADATFQVRLYEGSGSIELVYGEIAVGTGSLTSVKGGISNSATSHYTIEFPTHTANTTNNFVNTLATGPQAPLTSSADGSRRYYLFSAPLVVSAPTGLNVTNITAGSMTINWTDNSTSESGYQVFRSTDGINYTQIAQLPANSTSYTGVNLTGNTNYFWQVRAFNEGSLSSPGSVSAVTNACALSGIKTIPGDYPSISAAAADIAVQGLSGPLVLEIQASYTSAAEAAFPIVLGIMPCAGTSNTITIRPAAGVTGKLIESSSATGTINIDGGDYWIIDGRPGGTGTARELSIVNTATAGYAIQFINDATNNILRYVNVRGVANTTTNGVIRFSTTTGTAGNSNNLIEHSHLHDGATTPNNIIYSSGTTAAPNTDNNISNNHIYNYYNSANAANGVNIVGGNTGWTISNNHFYQTATRTATAGATHSGILISNTTGNNFTVTGNFIGGSGANASGSPYTIGGSFANRFRGISLSAGTTTSSLVQGNTITNFSFLSNSSATTLGGAWTGIYIANGNATVNQNTIGSSTGTGAIALSNATTGGFSTGIYSDAGTTVLNITNNSIGSITTTGGAAISHGFIGIMTISAGTASQINITGNLIGSQTTPSSIHTANLSTSTTAQRLAGIENTSSAAITISNNIIANLTNSYATAVSSTTLRGIFSSSGAGEITGNTIRNLTGANAGVGTGSSASVIGIHYTSTSTGDHLISRNTIHSIHNGTTTANAHVYGIYYAGPSAGTNRIERNFIHSLGIASTGTTATVSGIVAGGGVSNYQNNMIRLGIDAAGNAITVGSFAGIEKTTTANNNFYHNSIYVGGSGVTANNNSFAFRRTSTGTDDLRNNILVNQRSNASGTGKHYIIGLNETNTMTSNYNLVQGSGTGFVFGISSGVDYNDLSAWSAGTGLDANSLTGNPLFVNATGNASVVDLHVQAGTAAEANGILIASVTNDFDGEIRSGLTPVDIGADAGDFALAGIDVGATALVSPAALACFTNAETVTVTIRNYSTTEINFAVNNVTVNVTATGGYNSSLVLNSGTLAAGATMNVTMPATIDLSVNGAYTFNASAIAAGDVNAANDNMTPVLINVQKLGGTYTVGTGGDYPTLTAAVAAYNVSTCFTGPVTFVLTNAVYNAAGGETFPLVLNANAFAGTNMLTIRPAAGNTATITGAVNSGALIRLNGSDYITIDGSNNNTASRDLTITNSSTTTPTAISLSSLGAGAGASFITIKNLNISGAGTGTAYGISIGGGTPGTPGADNDNVSIINNSISTVSHGIYAIGTASVSAGGNDNLVISQNTITTNVTVLSFGIQLGNGLNGQISQNSISIETSAAASPVGISLETGFVSAVVERNNIVKVLTTATGGWGGRGITIGTGSATSNITVVNNMVSGVNGSNWTAFGNSSAMGIAVGVLSSTSTINNVTGGVNIYHNSVNLYGDYIGTSTTPNKMTAALYVGEGATNLDIRNNIFINRQNNTTAVAKSYAVYSAAANSAFTDINYNNYMVEGAQGVLGFLASDRINIDQWRTATGKDLNSVSMQVVFVSPSDLHLVPALNTLFDNRGTPIAGILIDFDGDTRSTTTPDIGADEYSPPGCTGAVGGTVVASQAEFCGSGNPSITASGFSVGVNSGYQWQSSSDAAFTTPVDIAGQNDPATLVLGAPVTQNTFYRLKVTCTSGTAEAYSNVLAITINPNPTVTVSPAGPLTLCGGQSQTLSVTTDLATPGIQWRRNGVNLTGETAATLSVSLSGSYDVVITNGTTNCSATSAAVLVSAYEVPANVTATASVSEICAGGSVDLTSSATPISPVILSEGFETGASGWSFIDSSSTGAGIATQVFHIANAPFNKSDGSGAFTNFAITGSHFAMAIPDRGGSGSQTRTFLVSPTFSTVGFTDGNLSFKHVYRRWGSSNPAEQVLVQMSNDNGLTWETVQSYTADQGTITDNAQAVTTVNIPVPAQFLNQSTVKLRFRYLSNWGYFWAIDDVSLSGTPPAYSYSWTSTPAGFTSNVQNPTGLTPAVTTTYNVTVTGLGGCTSTASVTVTIKPETAITTQPAAQAVCSGANATFTVAATGANLTYQWRKDGVDISGANAATLNITGATSADAGNYTVVVTGDCGTVTSGVAALSINLATSVVTQPVAQTVCAGANATFTAGGTGTGTITYQWRKDGADVAGATNATFTITGVTAADAGNYSVVITGDCGSVTSNAVALTVNAATTITTQPAAQAVCAGANSTFTVAAAGTGTLTYQWRKDGNDITGATSASYTITGVAAADAGNYTVVVTGTCGSVTSSAAALTVNAATAITTQPAAQTVCAGANASFTVAATGAGLTYQWRFNGTDISGATAATYTLNNVTAANAGNYSVVVTGTCGSVTSNAVALTVNAGTTITTQPANVTTCLQQTATFTVVAAGTGTLTYQWRKGTTPITGATSATLTITNITAADAGDYNVVVTGTCGAVTSANATLTVSGPCTSIPTVSEDVTSAKLLPNVVHNTSTLRVQATRTARINWKVVDMNGKVVMEFNNQVNAGQNDFQLQLAHLANGAYFLMGQTGNGRIETIRFIRH